MSIRTRWLDGKGPSLFAPRYRDALVSMELKSPRVIVGSVDDNGTRRVELAVEQDGVSLRLWLDDLPSLLNDLTEAYRWTEGLVSDV